MRDTQAHGLEQLRTRMGIAMKRRRRFISVTGGKGGVGKSTLALNLAVTYGRSGSSTIAIDGDLGMADLNLLLGLAPAHSMLDVIDGLAIDDAIVEASGIHLLPALNGSHRLANLDRKSHQRIVEIIADLRSRFDTVLVDCPAGIERNAMAVTALATEVVVVATPEPLSLADAYAALKILSTVHGVERAYLLPNQVKTPAQGAELAEQLTSLVTHFLGLELVVLPAIPHDPYVPHAAAAGLPIVVSHPDAPISRAIAKVVRALDAHLEEAR